MSISYKYLGFLHLSREYGIYFQEKLQLKFDYLKMPVNLVQYRGAVGNFHNRRFFNAKAVNKVFGHRYWMPTNSGTVLFYY